MNPGPIEILDEPFKMYKTVMTDKVFLPALKNTFVIWGVNFIPQILLALVLAVWFTSTRRKIKGQGFFKVVLYMPNIITAATVAILFSTLFGYPKGPINDLLIDLGIRDTAYQFGTDKTASKLIVAFIQFWQWYGNTMIVLIAGVLGISPDIYEAAQIDGANGVQTFFRITLPNLKTILLYTLITSLVGGLNMFDIPKLYLDGGPDGATETVSVFIYNQAFSGRYMYNRAAAASMFLFAIIGICTALLFYIMRDKDEIAEKRERRLQEKARRLSGKEI
jgi:multiple sugar transport system permease protein